MFGDKFLTLACMPYIPGVKQLSIFHRHVYAPSHSSGFIPEIPQCDQLLLSADSALLLLETNSFLLI
jgi:hypothetical protein